MKQITTQFVQDEQGQDLVEYSLLLAFVCIASAAMFLNAGSSMLGIWTATNSVMVNANQLVTNAAAS
jgi:Flp pilus assembly pilin Flp